MGVDTRKPLLPAPTESSMVDATTGGSATPTDLATDISRRTDKTSYSIPDDGSPITISTRDRSRHRADEGKISRHSHQSQTSLLIEYFEGGKGPNLNSRPSVRVKVTPSAARKIKDRDDHIQISEGGNRKPSYSRRISLGTPSKTKQLPEPGTDDRSISSYTSVADDPNQTGRRPPLEIEFLNREQGSELSGFSNARYIQPTSDISSMPPESTLETATTLRSKRSRSLDREDMYDSNNTLKAPSRRRSRSLSRERIAHKAAEKLSSAPRDVTNHKTKRNRHRSASKDLESDVRSPRRRSGKHREDDVVSPESSLLTNSALSSQGKAGDRNSFRSGTSKSSINNPKLLETVEDAIRRLILPELSELKKDQKAHTNRTRFERDTSMSRNSASNDSKSGLARRLSKHASAPDVTTPQVVVNKDSKDSGTLLEDQPKRRRNHHQKRDSGSSARKTSNELAVPDEQLHRKKSKGLRDAEAAAIVGNTLTAAALRHHDSSSSLDKSPRGKRRSGSRNAVPQINETEAIFQKHDVPPMPMRSEIDSEMTRESILSQRTVETSTPHQSPQIREVSRGSPASSTPTRKPLGTRNGLGTRHSNTSNQDLSAPGTPTSRGLRETSRSPLVNASPTGVAAASHLLNRQLDHDEGGGYGGYSNQRGLSPIQSVASYKDDATDPGQETTRKIDSSESLSSANQGPTKMEQRLSIDSLSSAPSTSLARSKRPKGVNLEKRGDGMNRHDEHGTEVGYSEADHWQDDDGNDNYDDPYRYSYEGGNASDPKIDMKHMTNYTDDSLDGPYVDGVAAGQHVAQGYAANPEYVHTPVAVESAIASLHELSVVDAKSIRSGNHSFNESLNRPQSTRELSVNGGGSPLKQRQDASSPDEKSFQQRMGATSPPQSVAESLDDEHVDQPHMGATGLPGAGSPIPEIGHIPDSEESDINTNPSIIQGPIGGVSHENRDHWPYKPTPPRSAGNQMSPQSEGDGARDLGVDAGQPADYDQEYYAPTYDDMYGSKGMHGMDQMQDPYMAGHMIPTPPGAKDEGYISAANPPSLTTPEPRNRGFGGAEDNAPGVFDSPSVGGDDPFTGTHQRHLSGYSHGMPSPLYDSATGRGIDRIQSKDIVALMDHLTVRDAQRNARDTEILVTLVRSAAEMRNSFEDMKKFISQQDDLLMDSNEKQHEKTQKIIGGPRPQPASAPRAPRQLSTDDDGEDMRSKRRNVFKRALKGLSLKSSNDLTKIEDMLVQLLDEVEALRAGQVPGTITHQTSINSNDQPRSGSLQHDYDPERQGSYQTAGDLSGYLPDSSRTPGDSRTIGDRQDSNHRVSPVMEGDEEVEELNTREQQLLDDHLNAEASRHQRGASVPLATPPRVPVAGGAHSNETTPKMSTDKSRKHKSSSSSFFPKISRWSKTTASSMGEGIRNTMQPGRKEHPSSEASRSGSELGHGAYNGDYYDPQGDDRIRSTYTLDEKQENRPPSPLVPSQVSDNPKYQAHRDSFDLQHPQPRQGPTGRYQSRLESQAQDFGSPISLNSEHWGSNPSLTRVNPNRQGGGAAGHLSPISDAGYSEVSGMDAKGPPRPPKISNDEPLVPQRPLSGSQQSYSDHVASRGSRHPGYERSTGSPARSSPTHTPPQRKPTGPRPITSSGQQSPGHGRFGSMGGRQRYANGQNRMEEGDY
ncbi:hypothetical protein FQN54_000482 [Arachnomyces sp. PD_36]|nr:hypothetical protein FQN54_000482 [Arachnomyces sp. PD_36]